MADVEAEPSAGPSSLITQTIKEEQPQTNERSARRKGESSDAAMVEHTSNDPPASSSKDVGNTTQQSPPVDRREPPAKRPRRGAGEGEAAGRGKRLFGLLNQTLSKAKEDNARRTSGEAGRRRAEVEARLQQKMKHDDEKIRRQSELSDQLEKQLAEAFDISLDIHSTEVAIRLRKAQKRRLGSFLVTESDLAIYDGEAAEDQEDQGSMRNHLPSSIDGRALAPAIATAIAPVGRKHPASMHAPDAHPVYFLPAKMLPAQDDQLDEQEDAVDEAIDAADEAWEERKKELREKLTRLQASIASLRDELVELEHGPQRDSAKTSS